MDRRPLEDGVDAHGEAEGRRVLRRGELGRGPRVPAHEVPLRPEGKAVLRGAGVREAEGRVGRMTVSPMAVSQKGGFEDDVHL